MLSLVWAFLRGLVTVNTLVEGFVVGYLVLWLASPIYGSAPYFKKFRLAISFVLYTLKELVLATLRVALIVIRPQLNIRPGIVAIPLDIKTDAEIMLLATLIALTPGTLALDVSADRRVIYVHTMDVGDIEEFRQEIKQGFERRVGELLR